MKNLKNIILIYRNFTGMMIEKIKLRYNYVYQVTDIEIFLKKIEDIKYLLQVLKNSLLFNFEYLNDLTAVDNLLLSKISKLTFFEKVILDQYKRFKLVYIITNLKKELRLKINIYLNKYEIIPSNVKIFNGILWSEREIFDMFGLIFEKNKDLRRILTDYGFFGNPLLKNFPVFGKTELFYDNTYKLVKYTFVDLLQNYRFYVFESVWDQYNLEK